MYAQDYDGTEIFGNGYAGYAGVDKGTTSRGQGWAGPLYPYIKSSQVFTCPSDSAKGSLVISYARNTNTRGQNQAIFTASSVTIQLFEAQGTAGTAGNALTDFTQPTEEFSNGGNYNLNDSVYGYTGNNSLISATGCMYIFNDPSNGSNPPIVGGEGGTCSQNVFYDWGPGRHFDASNYLFLDGHVKWLKAEQVSVGENAANAKNSAGWSEVGTAAGPIAAGTAALSGLQGTFSWK